MGLVEKIKKRGITVKRFNRIVCVFTVIISVLMFIAINMTSVLYDENHLITDHMVNWIDSSYGVQLASDYLTEQIRCFVISGDRKYLDNYFEEAKITKRREKALDVLKNVDVEQGAYQNLLKAMEESVALMDTEYYAARLAIEGYHYDVTYYPQEIQKVKLKDKDKELTGKGKIERAEYLLFDTNYRTTKETISTHMRSCIEALVDDLSNDRKEVSERLRRQMIFEHILAILMVVTLLLVVAIASSQVLYPLRKCVDYIRQNLPIPLAGAYELRFLAKTYNVIYQSNREKNEKLVFDASHDKLTGLYNRRGYEFLLDNLDLETSAVLMVDLDKFKTVNDTLGHDIGDATLVRVADMLKKYFMESSYICRLGGDEFVVIMVHTDRKSQDEISRIVGSINEKLGKGKNDMPPVSISVGVAFGEPNKESSVLFKEADTALYKVKGNGRRGVAFA